MPKKKILLVNGHSDTRQVFRLILERDGYEVFEAQNSVEGLCTADQERPDLITMEYPLRLPDGRTLAQALRSNPATASVRILLVTANVFPEVLQGALLQGVDAILTKPVLPTRMIEEVERLVGKSKRFEEMLPAIPT